MENDIRRIYSFGNPGYLADQVSVRSELEKVGPTQTLDH